VLVVDARFSDFTGIMSAGLGTMSEEEVLAALKLIILF
jgi:hypothetical protein